MMSIIIQKNIVKSDERATGRMRQKKKKKKTTTWNGYCLLQLDTF